MRIASAVPHAKVLDPNPGGSFTEAYMHTQKKRSHVMQKTEIFEDTCMHSIHAHPSMPNSRALKTKKPIRTQIKGPIPPAKK